MRAVLLASLLAPLVGCTAAKATYQLVTAEQALQRATDHGAPELAVYEYTMANRYLEKAREEAGYADYRVSVELSNKSAEWSDKAIISIEQRGSNAPLEIDDLDTIKDDPLVPPPDDILPPPVDPPTDLPADIPDEIVPPADDDLLELDE